MATKKTATTTKKSARKSAPTSGQTVTKVTTVKANDDKKRSTTPVSANNSSAAAVSDRPRRFNFGTVRQPVLTSAVTEFIGTFILAAVVLAVSGQSLFVMFALVAIILMVGSVNGAHLNPAFTIAAFVTKRTSGKRAIAYVVAQVLGALLALVVMSGFVGAAPQVSQQAAAYGQAAPQLFKAAEIVGGKEWIILVAELLGTTIFAFAVAAALRAQRITQAALYASGLYVAALVAGTGAAFALGAQQSQVGVGVIMNPALAASLQALKFEVWPLVIYIVTPIVGAIIGFALSDLLRNQEETV